VNCPWAGKPHLSARLPVPDVTIRRKRLTRACTCGSCKRCRDADAALRLYRRRKAQSRSAGRDDIDMDALNAYWERVKL
jgi:hypothetical protein